MIASNRLADLPITHYEQTAPLTPTQERLRTKLASRIYETGWSEGWTACLAAIEAKGLGVVLRQEAAIGADAQLALGAPGEPLEKVR